MPFQRNQRHGFRRSRSRSPYRRHQSFRRSRSPRIEQKRGHFSAAPRDYGRRQGNTSRDRGREVSPTRSPVYSKSRDSKASSKSLSEENDSGRYFKDGRHTESRVHMRSSSSRSPLRDQEVRSAHMDRVHSETRMEARIVRKKMTLTERFGVNERKFNLEENITIGLQRNPHVPISTIVNVDNKDFDFNKFVLKRHVDEGTKPIFDREEIKAFRHDDNLDDQDEFERRVITILPSKDSSGKSSSEQMDVDLSVRKSLSSSLSYGHHDDRQWVKNTRETHHGSAITNRRERDDRSSYKGEKLQITRWRTPSPRKEPQVRLDPRPDPRYEAKFRANREREEGSSHKRIERIENISHNPNDLRHSLLHRRISNSADDARYRIEAKRQDHDHKPGQGRDAWEVANERQHGQRDKNQSSVRQRRYSGDLRSILPDFSNREDKFEYEEWKDKPEMVPKGQRYFEHDNRWEDSGLFPRRARGRPFSSSFRSRPDTRRFPTSRGGYRPKPFSQTQYSRDRSSSRQAPGKDRDSFRPRGRRSGYSGSLGSKGRGFGDLGDWKHDMYDKLEKEDDNCPTSTT